MDLKLKQSILKFILKRELSTKLLVCSKRQNNPLLFSKYQLLKSRAYLVNYREAFLVQIRFTCFSILSFLLKLVTILCRIFKLYILPIHSLHEQFEITMINLPDSLFVEPSFTVLHIVIRVYLFDSIKYFGIRSDVIVKILIDHVYFAAEHHDRKFSQCLLQ